jgi:tetratricopeptide (TPR) repeat protein
MRLAAWTITLTFALATIGPIAAQKQEAAQTPNTQAGANKPILDLIREIGSDEQLASDMTKALGFPANQRGTWDYRQVGVFEHEGDVTSPLHVYAIHDGDDPDVLVFTRRGGVSRFIRATRDGDALAALAFDDKAQKQIDFSQADAQAETKHELDFWKRNVERTRNWWFCEGELGGANPVKPEAKIAACQWILAHEHEQPRSVSMADMHLGLAYGKDDEKKKMEYLNAAVKADPANNNAWAQLCSAQNWVSHDSKAALVSCTKVIELAPKSAEGWTYRGDIYLRDKRFEEAISDYDHAIELGPEWMWPWDNRGEAYLRMGKPYRAIIDFNEVIKTGPGYAMGYIDRGIAHLILKDFDAAKADFEAGLKIDPKCGDCLVGRGLVALQKGDKTAADSDIATGKKLSPKVAEAFADDGITIP